MTASLHGSPGLASPLRLPNGQQLANRLVKSAMSEALADENHAPGERIERLYERWGRGGCGLLVTGNVTVDRRHLSEPGNVAADERTEVGELRDWAHAGQRHGARIWMQINHPGRQANRLASREQPVAPIAIASRTPGAGSPRALTGAEIEAIVDAFGHAAVLAEEAGFDGVQLHGAHGYLISQFLSPLTNRRHDEWGGDPERRMRFVLSVLDRVRRSVAPRFAVGIKLNSADFQRGGFTEAQSRDVVERLVGLGADLIEVSGGNYETPAMTGPPASASTQAREAYFLDYAEQVRDRCGEAALAVTGGFRSRKAMEEAVAEGACDLVGLARPLCTEPDTPAGLLAGTIDRVRAGEVKIGLRPVTGRLVNLRTADGALDIQWHTDQLHRLAGGQEPDLDRSWLPALGAALRRNGADALRSRRR